jgi:hypothetical protein
MVPAAWVTLDELPLSPAGKLDRKALPSPEEQAAAGTASYLPPRSPLEALLAGLFAQTLGVERIGVHDDFFDLGGNSILATQVISTVRELLVVELPLRNVFEAPTVARVAALLEERFGGLDEPERRLVDSILQEFELLDGLGAAGATPGAVAGEAVQAAAG